MNYETPPAQPEHFENSDEYLTAVGQLTRGVDALLDQDDPRITRTDGFTSAYTVNMQETTEHGRTVTHRSPIRRYTRTTDGAGRRSYEVDGHALAHLYPDPTDGVAANSTIRTEWTVAADGSIIMPVTSRSSQSESNPGIVEQLDAESVGQRAEAINETTHLFDPGTQEIRENRKTGAEILPKRRSKTDRVLGILATLGN